MKQDKYFNKKIKGSDSKIESKRYYELLLLEKAGVIYFTVVNIKPLSTNKAWQGRRFKTKEYKDYELELLYKLPKIEMPQGKLEIHYIFYFSNIASDIDNAIKQFQDVLCKKYNFDDKMIYKIIAEKKIVKRGAEKIEFNIKCLDELSKK